MLLCCDFEFGGTYLTSTFSVFSHALYANSDENRVFSSSRAP